MFYDKQIYTFLRNILYANNLFPSNDILFS